MPDRKTDGELRVYIEQWFSRMVYNHNTYQEEPDVGQNLENLQNAFSDLVVLLRNKAIITEFEIDTIVLSRTF